MDPLFSSTLFETANSAGEDLEYAPAFLEFSSLATPSEERQVGEHITPAQPPNWNEVLKMGKALLEKSRDLRILTKVCQAALYRYGLPGFAQGLALMAHWIENDWDYLYPQIEIDGDYDPLSRSGAISEISAREGLVHTLRQAVFLESPVGSVNVFAAEQVLEGKQEDEKAIISSKDQLSKMLITERAKNQHRLDAVSSIAASLASINSTLKVRLKPEDWPNLDLLTKIVTRLNRFIVTQLPEEAQESVDEEAPSDKEAPVQTDEEGETAVTVSASRKSSGLPLMLSTRTEAYKALALAREYFERNEPSHPASLLIQRIERLSGADFLAIIEELIPDAMKQAQQLGGNKE